MRTPGFSCVPRCAMIFAAGGVQIVVVHVQPARARHVAPRKPLRRDLPVALAPRTTAGYSLTFGAVLTFLHVGDAPLVAELAGGAARRAFIGGQTHGRAVFTGWALEAFTF